MAVRAQTGRRFTVHPDDYEPHLLHRAGAAYPETNCYVDVVVEMLHGAGYEPLAALPCALLLDFEGDQFTFFKPEPEAIRRLFGVDIHEMQPYRDLPTQIDEQLRAGRTLIVESDSWFLPDTAGTSYRSEHVKSSIAPAWIDIAGAELHYFHNGGLYRLTDDDFRGALRVDIPANDERLPPYTELVRFDAGPAATGDALRTASTALLRDTLSRRAATDPFAHYRDWVAARLDALVAGPPAGIAAHVFATARMAGAAAWVGATYVRWLLGDSGAAVAARFDDVAAACTTLSFKLSRRRAFDPAPLLDQAGEAWAAALGRLDELVR